MSKSQKRNSSVLVIFHSHRVGRRFRSPSPSQHPWPTPGKRLADGHHHLADQPGRYNVRQPSSSPPMTGDSGAEAGLLSGRVRRAEETRRLGWGSEARRRGCVAVTAGFLEMGRLGKLDGGVGNRECRNSGERGILWWHHRLPPAVAGRRI
ncbi:defective in exine formation protein [Striga asiatica]|uniref:Defective in exine formation protein n=1 Tax=Striga asiatica TaxID=4170 RepID=A0A5A7QFQ1_STRAF|nr:defective in exine formation protein [Striga asiatica]